MSSKRTVLIIAIAFGIVCIAALMHVAAVPKTSSMGNDIALVNKQSVSKGEFRDYIKASIARRHFAVGNVEVSDLEEILNGYIKEQILVYQDAGRLGLFGSEDFQRAYELGENRMIAGKYVRGKLREALVVTEEDLSDYIPSQWIQLKITQILLLDRGQAEAVLAEARAGADFIELVREYSVGPAAQRDGDLGYRFPGSGYFLPAHDVYLFSLEAGEISDVVETPLGPAVCRIEDKKVFTEHEIEALLSKPRGVVFNQKVQKHVREIRENTGVELYSDPLYKCVEAMYDGRKLDALIVKAGDREFHFIDLQRTIPVPYDQIYIEPSVQKLFELYRGNVESKISDYLLAQEARIFGVEIETATEKREMQKLKRMIALRMMGERIFAGLAVTDDEAREYFKENPDEFNILERVRFWQILLPDEATAGLVHEKLMAGESFKELAVEYSTDKRSKGLGGMVGVLRKQDIVPELADVAFSLLPGDYSDAIETEHGYHIIMIDGTFSAKTYEFDEIRGKVRNAVLRGRQEKRFGEYIEKLFADAVIEINDEALHELLTDLKSRKPKTSPHNFGGPPGGTDASPHGSSGVPTNSSGASPHGSGGMLPLGAGASPHGSN